MTSWPLGASHHSSKVMPLLYSFPCWKPQPQSKGCRRRTMVLLTSCVGLYPDVHNQLDHTYHFWLQLFFGGCFFSAIYIFCEQVRKNNDSHHHFQMTLLTFLYFNNILTQKCMIIRDRLFSTLVLTVFITQILEVHSRCHTTFKALRPEREATNGWKGKLNFCPRWWIRTLRGSLNLWAAIKCCTFRCGSSGTAFGSNKQSSLCKIREMQNCIH